MRPLIQGKIVNMDMEVLARIELQLTRIADILEHALKYKPEAIPNVDFDPDDYSGVVYTDEEQELVQQHLNKRIAGIVVDGSGLY